MKMTHGHLAGLLVALLVGAGLPGCGADDAGGSGSAGPPPSGITQAGGQDFGLFRQILTDGGIPTADTIDDLGFFAEHKLTYPDPTCGQDICMHGLLGVMGNMLTGSTCTLIQIGMNTPLNAETMERPPMNLVLAIDASGSMAGEPIEYVREGLRRMLDHLEDGDQVSIVAYSDSAAVVVQAMSISQRKDLEVAIGQLSAGGKTNMYDGLFTALELSQETPQPGWQSRVILLSDGVPTAGIQSAAKLASLAKGYAGQGIAVTTIGVGAEFDVEVMRSIAELGAGGFYFVEDPQALLEVFTEEVKTFLVPVALDVRIDVSVGAAYRLGGAYGTNGWSSSISGGFVEIPSLFVAGRTDAGEPPAEGRRGGGGAIIVELIPDPDLSGVAESEQAHVGTVLLTWKHPVTGEVLQQTVTLQYPQGPSVVEEEGFFTDETVAKGFVMLNLLAAFQLAAELAQDSDPGAAIGVLQTVGISVEGWLEDHPDGDIQDDLTYVDLFVKNLQKAVYQTPVNSPPEPWPYD